MNFNEQYNHYLNIFNQYLDDFLSNIKEVPEELYQAMTYAVKDGGKRVRPVLCLSFADLLGVDIKRALPYALAIELIHSYSLVHDDLPAMDNDDYRRGKLSTHKKFGEAMGILAGDALLNLAYEILFESDNNEASKLVAEFAGSLGMIKGQVLDVNGEKVQNVDQNILYEIVINKTAKLITAPILVASILCGKKYFNELKDFGFNLGLLFQTTDDIFDAVGDFSVIGKTPHKDQNKITAIKIYGYDGAVDKAREYYEKCIAIIDKLPNNQFLLQFTEYMYKRKK